MNNRFRTSTRVIALAIGAAALAAACGGDDDSGGPAQELPCGPASAGSAAAGDVTGPVSTVSPEVPEVFEGSIGPLDVTGDFLVPLDRRSMDDDPALCSPAPVAVGLDFDGTPTRVDAASDGPTMVVFLAHWCPHCNDEIPVLNELRDDGRFPDGLNIVAISTSPSAEQPNFPPGEWLDDKDWTYPAIADGVDMEDGWFIGAQAYGVSAFPFIVLIDGDGDVAARWSGGLDADDIIERIETRLGL